ncbi:MAG: lamin tail domain-containing protein, partial [Candidatus Andersenbacteria bacterium]|nr:lamin tail domain-containing protein [Candidatus Andersenbacteria bacterium]
PARVATPPSPSPHLRGGDEDSPPQVRGSWRGCLSPAPIMHTVPPRVYMDSVVMKVLLLVFSVGLTVPSGLAFYSDSEISAGNSFTVAESFQADHVVISEVQIRGASTLNDFVELYNPTSEDVDVSGWKLRKKSSTGTESSVVVLDAGSEVSAHGFFLWANSLDGYAASLEADASTTQTLAPDNSVALRDADDVFVDQVAWGSGAGVQFIERAPFAQNPGQHQSIERKARQGSTATSLGSGGSEETAGNGFDTDHNAFDFVLQGSVNQQNSGSAAEEL